MTAVTLTPVAFLTVRYDEEQAFLERMIAVEQPTHIGGDQYDWEGGPVHYSASRPGGSQVFLSTRRALADVKVDRAILALHTPRDEGAEGVICAECGPFEDIPWRIEQYGLGWPCKTVRLLTSKYAQHPDCRPEWLPTPEQPEPWYRGGPQPSTHNDLMRYGPL